MSEDNNEITRLMSEEGKVQKPYRKPTPEEIPYAIAARSVFKPEGREDERGLYLPLGSICENILFIHREYWDADPPKSVEHLKTPLSHVRFTYTSSRPCENVEDCKKAVKDLQKQHLDQGLADINYNFLVGGDGTMFEGRGWNVETERPEKYANLKGKAIDIAFIGNFKKVNPPWEMEKNVYDFIKYGVDELIIDRKFDITSYRD